MKTVTYRGPGDVFDARQLPGFGPDEKFVFYSPDARYDAAGQPLAAERRGNSATVTNDQALELLTHGGARFVEVEAPAAAGMPVATPAPPSGHPATEE